MPFTIELTPRAQKELRALERRERLLIAAFIDGHLDGVENPCADPAAKRLHGVANGWRWRIGVWRLLGTVEGDRLVIRLFRIGHRREVYRGL